MTCHYYHCFVQSNSCIKISFHNTGRGRSPLLMEWAIRSLPSTEVVKTREPPSQLELQCSLSVADAYHVMRRILCLLQMSITWSSKIVSQESAHSMLHVSFCDWKFIKESIDKFIKESIIDSSSGKEDYVRNYDCSLSRHWPTVLKVKGKGEKSIDSIQPKWDKV